MVDETMKKKQKNKDESHVKPVKLIYHHESGLMACLYYTKQVDVQVLDFFFIN